MFSKEKNIEKKPSVMERNILAKKTKFVGEITSDGDFRIDGTLEGTLKTKGRVIIGLEGVVNGKVECEFADVEGNFTGELNVNNTLVLKSTANISGEVVIGKLSVEAGATFNATCSMKGTMKELKNGHAKISQKTTA